MKESNIIHVHSVSNFKKHKNKFIELINKTKFNYLITDKERISKTDFNLELHNKKYLNYFLENIFKDFLKDFNKKLNVNKFKLSKIWYQTYKEGDIITFPAYLNHRSKRNTFKKDKIIVSFNLDILEHN